LQSIEKTVHVVLWLLKKSKTHLVRKTSSRDSYIILCLAAVQIAVQYILKNLKRTTSQQVNEIRNQEIGWRVEIANTTATRVLTTCSVSYKNQRATMQYKNCYILTYLETKRVNTHVNNVNPKEVLT